MQVEENNTKDIIMDLNIPFKIYLLLFLIIFFSVILKYFLSKEEIFEFIENTKHNSLKLLKNENDKINLLTKINTKINRDFLDNSKYYNEVGYFKIFGYKKEEMVFQTNKTNKINMDENNKNKIIIKKCKKVCFSNNIIFDNEYKQ